MKRAIVVVLDGCGAGAAPDHASFGDGAEVNTLGNVWRHAGGIDAPHLVATGWFAAAGVGPAVGARYGRLKPLGRGKDSVTGHWEMMGAVVETPFPTYPQGFPIGLIKAFEAEAGVQTIGNRPASGTAILDELGEQHVEMGTPIVYTSADSVFQIAAHEEVVPVERLYEMCRIARRLCQGADNVQRVIARPFLGSPGAWVRTERRKDFPLPAPANLVDEVGDVLGIGVVPELFDGRGFRAVTRTQSNPEHETALLAALEAGDARFIFANFEDFDMKFGHRNDPAGFAVCLETFDGTLARIQERLGPEDLLILTADHGNDPTDASTDHSREFVPVCVVGQEGPLGDRDGFCDVGATVAAHLGVTWLVGRPLAKG